MPEEEGKDIDLSKPHTHTHLHGHDDDEDEAEDVEKNRLGMRPAYRKEEPKATPDKDEKGASSRTSLEGALLLLSALTFLKRFVL